MPRPTPHFRVQVHIARHPKTRDLWADPMHRGILVELGRRAIEQQAGKRGGVFTISSSDLAYVCGTRNEGAARRRFEAFLTKAREAAAAAFAAGESATDQPVIEATPDGERTGNGAETTAHRWRIEIRNLAKRHGFAPSNGRETGSLPSTEDRETEDRGPKGDPTPPAAASRRAKRRESKARELAEDGELTKLIEWFYAARQERFGGGRPARPSPRDLYAADRLIRIDGRTPEQIGRVVRFLFAPEPEFEAQAFWAKQIRSLTGLREKWDRVAEDVQAERERANVRAKKRSAEERSRSHGDSLRQAAASMRQRGGAPAAGVDPGHPSGHEE